MKNKTFSLIILLAVLISGALTEAASTSPAAEVFKHIKLKRGVVVTCNLKNLAMPLALARQSEMSIYMVEDNAKVVAARRKEIEAAGLSALRIRVEAGPLEDLEYPNLVANVVIVQGVTNADLLKELHRILRPQGFLVLLPDGANLVAKSVSSALGQTPNKQWEGAHQCGSAVVVQSKKREGAAEWTHYYQKPDNNRYSPDKYIKDSLRLLWYGEPVAPLGDLFLTQGLSAGGRIFLTDVYPEDTTRARLTCLDAYNGTMHWVRAAGGSRYEEPKSTAKKDPSLRMLRLPGQVQLGEMAVSDEHIYLTDGPELLIMDARTGKDIKRYKAPAPTNPNNCWRFVAYQGKVMIGYANAPTPVWAKPPSPIVSGGPPTLFALNRFTGAKFWIRGATKDETLDSNFMRPLAIGEGRIILRSGNSLHAIDFESGKTVWQSDELPEKAVEAWWEGAIHQGKFLLSAYAHRGWGGHRFRLVGRAFATSDGKVIENLSPIYYGKNYFSSEQNFLGTPLQIRLGCNYGSGAGSIYFHRDKFFIETPNTPIDKSQQNGSYGGFRAACGIGVIPANGLAHLLPNGLGCGCAPLRATVTYEPTPASETANMDYQPQPESQPGSDTFSSELEQPAAPSDWPTYLADNARSGITRQDVSKTRKIKWEIFVSGKATPCIAAAGKVFLGSSD